MQASKRNTLCSTMKTLLVCVLLRSTDSASQLAGVESDIHILQLLLPDSRALEEHTNTLRVDRRQISEPTTATHSCNDSQAFVFLNNLNRSCIDAISSVSLASPTYLSSDIAETHINDICREDCAGDLLIFDKMCPEYFPNFATYLQGACSLDARNNRCAFSVRENNGLRVFQKCFEETNVYEGCRRRCKNALVDFNSDIGCCIKSFYNATWDFFDNLQQFQPHLNYSIDPFVWETCEIPYPYQCSNKLFPSPSPPPAPTPITTNSLTPQPLCTDSEEMTELGDTCLSLLTEFKTPQGLQSIAQDSDKTRDLCSVDCGGQYAKQCRESGSDFYEVLELFCGEFSGEICGHVLAQSYSNLLQNLSLCSDTESVTGFCPNGCLSVLIEATSELGCCLFPLTVDGVGQRVGWSAVIEGQLWSQCGLELPEKCSDPFPIVAEGTQSTASNTGIMTRSNLLSCMSASS